jgi:hypothetical protein
VGLDAQLAPDVHDDSFEAAIRVGVEDARFELGRGADGLEADLDFASLSDTAFSCGPHLSILGR